MDKEKAYRIVKIICEYYEISFVKLTTKTGEPRINQIRKIFCLLTRYYESRIITTLLGCSRVNLYYLIRTGLEEIETNKSLRKDYENLKKIKYAI